MFDLEKEIGAWLQQFSQHRAFDHGSLREMELHLRDHIEDQVAQGKSEKESFEAAVDDFGQIPEVAKEEFSTIRRKSSIRSFLFSTMLNSYFKTAFRNAVKNPMSSFINVFGLAVAIGICIVVYAFFIFDSKLDQFHTHKNEVHAVTFVVDRNGTEQQYGLSPAPLGQMLVDDFPQVKKMCRVQDRNMVIKKDDKVFHERIRYVDPEFLEIFTFPLKWGVSTTLRNTNSIILSNDMAVKYFGSENPIGQNIEVIFNENNSKTFAVAGVVMPFPRAHIIEFDFLINFGNLKTFEPNFEVKDWSEFVSGTLVQIESATDLETVVQGMEKYKLLQNAVEEDWAIKSFELISIADLHVRSNSIRNGLSNDYNGEARLGLPIIAVIMLALACFNYLNIAIVSAAKRLKEIGLRKVIGANRRLVVVQFLCENILLTFFALIMGLVFAITVFIPWFSNLSGDPIQLELIDGNLVLFLVSILFFTGVVSGIYPALYISRFQVVSIFKGSVKFGKKNTLTKIFLTLQLILTCAGITCAVIFVQNNTFQNTRSWGYDQNHTLYLPVPDQSAYERLMAALQQETSVLSIAGSSHHLGRNVSTEVVHLPDREYEVDELQVAPNYFETMGLTLAAGRFFIENQESDREAVVINEKLAENLQLGEAVGSFFKVDSINYEIVGVVKDFHLNNFHSSIKPIMFRVANKRQYRFLTLKVRTGSESTAYRALQTQWSALFPEIPFQGGYQRDVWSGFFQMVDTAERFYKVVAFIAVILASLGLYGLITLNVAGRIKEFSVRKTLGAGAKHLTANILKQYMVLLTVAFTIGMPFSYFLAKASMEMLYAYPMPMTLSGIAISSLILLTVLMLVFLTQVRRVVAFNPVDGLKVE